MPKAPPLAAWLHDGEWNNTEFKAAREALHESSLRWYRSQFHAANPGFDVSQPDHDFRHEWGYLVKVGGQLLPTRGCVALFGSLRGVRNLLPRPVLDVRFLGYGSQDDLPETRWIDRLVCEENILESWQQLLAKYMFFMPKTFRDHGSSASLAIYGGVSETNPQFGGASLRSGSWRGSPRIHAGETHIDPATLTRRDAPAGFRVFREAAMNLLIHQDYGDHSRKALIEFFTDGIQLWNPGDSFGDDKRLLEPGEKELRNPAIAMALRRIEMCEQAGTGLRMMRREWQALGHAPPRYSNDRAKKSFELFLPDAVSRAVVGVNSGTAHPVTPPVTPPVRALMELLGREGELSNADIRTRMQLKDRAHVREHYIGPALAQGLIEYTLPGKPTSRLQRYRLSEAGRHLRAAMARREAEPET